MTFTVQDKNNYYLYNDNHYCLWLKKALTLNFRVPKNLFKTILK
ncbi:hypothetical protein J658_2462 [Acinetobacter baumannii 573719]|nr:hypothetical protein J658_4203 [Acinetobacter baumannii 573719]EXS22526.1 hypothetical protein J658_2462 [Acinetobacter baumannii 573719]